MGLNKRRMVKTQEITSINKEKKKKKLLRLYYPPAKGGKIATISPFLITVSLFWCGVPLIKMINFTSFEILNISNIVLTVLPKGNVIVFFGGALSLKLAKNFTVAVISLFSIIFFSCKVPFIQ